MHHATKESMIMLTFVASYKIVERYFLKSLISEHQYGFKPRKSTTDAMFALSVDGKAQGKKKLTTRFQEESCGIV